jgi:hypothetical protein
MHQITMTGPDWLGDRDKKSQARANAARSKAALDCARKLSAAADAISAFTQACIECDDASRPRGADDSGTILVGNICEYAGWLESKYGEK